MTVQFLIFQVQIIATLFRDYCSRYLYPTNLYRFYRCERAEGSSICSRFWTASQSRNYNIRSDFRLGFRCCIVDNSEQKAIQCYELFWNLIFTVQREPDILESGYNISEPIY